MTYYTTVDSPLGRILLTSDGVALTGLHFEGDRYGPAIAADWHRSDSGEPFPLVRRWLAAYFDGETPTTPIPLAPHGTPFQQRVWQVIASIPYGRTVTYHQLATRVGNPSASRAAGAATGRNPISLIVPCHRVVGSDGSLTGYAAGLDRKRALLALETHSHHAIA